MSLTCFRWRSVVLAAALLCLSIGWPPSGIAQVTVSNPDLIEPLIGAAKSQGLGVVVIGPQAAKEVVEPQPIPSGGAALAALAARIAKQVQALASAVAAPGWPASSSDPTKPLVNGVLTVIGLAVGLLLVRRTDLEFRTRPASWRPGADTMGRPARIARAALGILVAAVAAMILPFVVYGPGSRTVELVGSITEIFLRCAVVFLIAAPLLERARERGGAEGRLDPMLVLRDLRLMLTAIFLFASAALTMTFMYPDPALETLARLAFVTLVSGLVILLAWRHRDGLAFLASTGFAGRLRSIGRSAWGLVAAYVLLAWLIACVRVVLKIPEAVDIVLAPAAALLGGVAVYHLALWAFSFALRRKVEPPSGAARASAADARVVQWPARVAKAAGVAAAVVLAVERLGLPMQRPDGSLAAVPAVAIVLLLAYAVWAYASEAIDRRIALETGNEAPLDADAEAGPGRTRLATLLPIMRNALQVAIGFVAVLMLLHEAGVNTTPIFASAGILGLAIGFGAQSLVKDIISGLFFLLDDAFRLGEYIETGGLKGTVERISIRSMQLRHQNGPLNTIAFGSINELTNYSRDWVIMKLPILLTHDTDVERVRKLVKKLGTELLADPDVGHRFLEPLKSQGVSGIDSFGITMRVKFKTRPGDQFTTRRIVYAKLREMFEQESIRFASRDVKVTIDAPAGTTPNVHHAMAAVAKVIDEPAPAAATGS